MRSAVSAGRGCRSAANKTVGLHERAVVCQIAGEIAVGIGSYVERPSRASGERSIVTWRVSRELKRKTKQHGLLDGSKEAERDVPRNGTLRPQVQ